METAIPSRWGPALRGAIWGAAPFIFFMAAVIEGVIAGNYRVAFVCTFLFFASIALVIYWDQLVPSHLREELRLSLQYLHDRDSQLGPAIISMARQSAYGRWFAAQHLVHNGAPISPQHLYQVAAGQVMQQITDGDLEVRGRRPDPDQLGLESIDRTHWRSSWLWCVPDRVALWKIIIGPKGGIELDQDGKLVRADDAVAARRTSLLNYDLLVVDAYQFEKLWPPREKVADRKRRKFLRDATRRGFDVAEIRRLSDPPGAWLGLLILAVIGLVALIPLYLFYQGKWPDFRPAHVVVTQQNVPQPTAAPTPVPQINNSQPSPSKPNLNAEDIATKIVVWNSIQVDMNELTDIINTGYNLLNKWSSDPPHAAQQANALAGSLNKFRIKLARLRDDYATYSDISDSLKEIYISGGRPPVPGTLFDRLARSIEGFSQELNANPPNLTSTMTPHVGALKRDLDAVHGWQTKITQTSVEQVKELANMEPK